MPVRLETLVDGYQQAAQEWQTVFNGVPVPPNNLPYGSWGNLPGGAALGGYFDGHERRRVVKIGMQWGTAGNTGNGAWDGTGVAFTFFRTASGTPGAGAWEAYAPNGVALDCHAMGLLPDDVYREFVFPAPYPARAIQWFKGFDDYRVPFNGIIKAIRVFTDDWSPSTAAQGTVRVVEPFGSGQPPVTEGASGAWEITDDDGALIAWRGNPQGWQVAWNGVRFVVKRPLSAPVSENYLLRFRE